MVGPLLLLAGAYAAKKAGLLKGGTKKIADFSKGPTNDAAQGLLAKLAVNVTDKTVLGGRMTSIGISQNIGGFNLKANLTDLAVYLLLNGFKVDKKTLKKALFQLGPAKVAEAKNWIDPPISVDTSGGGLNVSYTPSSMPSMSPYSGGGVS